MTDTYVLIALGCAALFVVWLVFSLVKKLFGVVLLVAVVVAAYLLWNNPEMQRSVVDFISGLIGNR